ncbi:hypothetical protein IVA94_14720 [Bradyrhizobium sp. 156]|uniref:hypothetical protein n=1 Tax=Bradyrhizobium sp. 156 TaxID=2782630 RepID=UPI001FFA1476|nr:hypothetical protein [Bradyrhizobium sp. 156]MCK1322122.1 hypothetical protein [Bradyrhizobium sp. 156]
MKPASQLSFFDADQAAAGRDAGMALAELAEAMENPDFSTEALNAIRRVAKRQETLFVDDVLAECKATPHHHNAWGMIWVRAIKERIIIATNQVKHSCDPAKHRHAYRVYRSLQFRRMA